MGNELTGRELLILLDKLDHAYKLWAVVNHYCPFDRTHDFEETKAMREEMHLAVRFVETLI